MYLRVCHSPSFASDSCVQCILMSVGVNRSQQCVDIKDDSFIILLILSKAHLTSSHYTTTIDSRVIDCHLSLVPSRMLVPSTDHLQYPYGIPRADATSDWCWGMKVRPVKLTSHNLEPPSIRSGVGGGSSSVDQI